MKKVLIILCGLLTLNVFLFNHFAYAYSLDDVKKDYPKFKIKARSFQSDTGNTIKYREGKIMKVSSGVGAPAMQVDLVEGENGHKNVTIYVLYSGSEWRFWDRVTIGDGRNAYDVFPDRKPYRTTDEGTRLVPIFEQLTFYINNEWSFRQWEKAKQIRVKGEGYYYDIPFNQAEYNSVMSVIKRFLDIY